MTMRARTALLILGACAFAAVSVLAFRGYLTPEMMVYFLTFQWCL
jgi:hypothetical protein